MVKWHVSDVIPFPLRMVRPRQPVQNGNGASLPADTVGNGHIDLEEVKYAPEYSEDQDPAETPQNGATPCKRPKKEDAYVKIKKGKEKKPLVPSPFRAIACAFGPYFMLGGLYKFLFDAVSFLGPFLLG